MFSLKKMYMLVILFVFPTHATPPKCKKKLQEGDRFLQKPPSQPKRVIARHLARLGIEIPIQYKSLDEAIHSGQTFIVRSESPHEYAGAAGLLESHVFTPEIIERARKLNDVLPWDQINVDNPIYLQKYLERNVSAKLLSSGLSALIKYFHTKRECYFYRALRFHDILSLDQYAKLMNLDFNSLQRSVTYSLWKYVPGSNHFMIADSAIPNRYHLFSQRTDQYPYELSYAIIQDGKIHREAPTPDYWLAPTGLRFDEARYGLIQEIIDFYESVRQAPGFDPKHAPVVEFQCDKAGHYYFLQYHRSRDILHADFRIDAQPLTSNGYIPVDFVRGSTPAEGYYIDVLVNNESFIESIEDYFDASFEIHDDYILREIRSRKKQLHFDRNNMNEIAMTIGCKGHCLISELFNPEISLSFNPNSSPIIPPDMSLSDILSFRAHIISDGSEAYIKILSYIRRPEPINP